MINLFYEEPDGDRWLPWDRFPRRVVRRVLRGRRRPGGQERVFLNLCAGLDLLGIPYRRNDYGHARRHSGALCCILGKRHVLEEIPLPNPRLVGPCCHDHSSDAPDLAAFQNVRRILVPGEWMRAMCAPAWGDKVQAWPVGIDTEHWRPPAERPAGEAPIILYNKIRWDHAQREETLLQPIRAELDRRALPWVEITYGHYRPEDYRALLGRARAMVFVCEHETQGLAYQEALASGVPVIAWEHGGAWLDPSYHPHRVVYGPVSAVPYWSPACGEKFADAAGFPDALERFFTREAAGEYHPRDYITENLSLEKCAAEFAAIAAAAA